MSRGSELRHVRGLPLAGKIAGALSVLMALAMFGMGFGLNRFVEETVTEEVRHAAVDAARAAAQADLDAWTAHFGTEDQGLSRADIQAKVDAMSSFDFRQYDGDEARKAQIAFNRERLSRVLGDDTRILAAEVFRFDGGQRGALVTASYAGEGSTTKTSFSPAAGRELQRYGDGESQEGWLTVGNDRWHVFRGSYPLRAPDGTQQGEIAVHILADAIAEATSSFDVKVAYAALAAVLVGAALTWLLVQQITKPLRHLQDDIRAVAAGDLEHHTRPRSSDEIGQLARTFDHMTRTLAEAREAEREVERSRRQMAVAAEVTDSLFPETLPRLAGWDMAGAHDAGGMPGGGTYDALAMPGGRQGFLLAEASGGGVPAALVAAMARSTLRMIAEREADPGAVMREANARLSPDLRQGMYVSALLAVLEPDTGRVVLANAGHAPLLHHHAEVDGLESVLTEGIALGFDKGPVFDQTLKVAEVTLEPGDTAVLYAHAATELEDGDGQELGEKRLLGLVKRELARGGGCAGAVDRIVGTLRKFHGGELGPEVTWLTFGRRG